jgi:hypothetical protein
MRPAGIMAKEMGNAALAAAIVAIIVPGYGLFVSAIAIVLSVGAALAGDRVFATATSIIAAVNTLFMSPLMWFLIRDRGESNVRSFYIFFAVFLVAPFVAMLLNSRGKVVIR